MDVDYLIVEEFARGEQTPWRLNCLVYTGAVLVSDRTRRIMSKRTPPKQEDQSQKKANVEHLRRTIGWLESEIGRRKEGRKATSR